LEGNHPTGQAQMNAPAESLPIAEQRTCFYLRHNFYGTHIPHQEKILYLFSVYRP